MQQICSKCNRGMPANRQTCMYCGGLPKESAGEDKAISCPRCRVSMDKDTHGGVVTDRCPKCQGVWYDRGELEALLFQEEDQAEPAPGHATAPAEPPGSASGIGTLVVDDSPYLCCPRCGKHMTRKNYMRLSGIIVDVCGYHGIYLDHGELERIRDFYLSGGPELMEARQQQDAELQAWRRKQAQIADARMGRRMPVGGRRSSGIWTANMAIDISTEWF